jgi:hypothetical protein
MQPMSIARRHPGVVIVAVSVLIGLFCAMTSVSKVGLFPPKFTPRNFDTAGAVTHVLVDRDRSRITDRRAGWLYFDLSKTRADLLAHLMVTAPVVDYIARRAGVPADQVASVAPIPGLLGEPGSEQRARDLLLATKPYRLEAQASSGTQVIDVYVQAPSVAQAERLADASVEGLRDYLAASEAGKTARKPGQKDIPLSLVQLGPARGAVLTGGTRMKLAALTFLLAFALACGALRALLAVRRRRAPSDDAAAGTRSALGARPTVTALRWESPTPSAGGAVALPAPRVAFSPRKIATGDGNWPRTTRALPWMLAAFVAMLWLIPFDSIQLNIPTPIDLKLDRIVLPFIVVTWVLSLAIGGRGAPRLRLTWIHAAVAAYVVFAFLSVILDAGSLNQALELDTSLKKLPLLISYLMLFLMMASVIRPAEVRAFLKYTLGLSVLCALGMIWEHKGFHNPFVDLSKKLLPSPFEVTMVDSGWDTAGRRMVHGPTMHPLPAATMLSMAFPIAVLGVIHARQAGAKIVYGIAAAILIVGVLATQRKTGLVAPLAVMLTLAYFRRRELLKLAPLAVILLVALLVAAPGTLAPVMDQFKPTQLSEANTVNDRASDYDAIRPDVLSHVAFGRGYGSYQPLGHRILDSEVLLRLVEMGVLGLAAFALLGVSVVACARRTIHSRHPVRASPALAGAAAAIVFLVVALLFDSTSYAQVMYIFLCCAALVVVVVKAPDDPRKSPLR